MINYRLLISTLAGLFLVAVGLFTLTRNARGRMHRSFGLYAISAGVVNFTGYFFIFFDYSTAATLYRISQIGFPLAFYFLISFIHDLTDSFDRPSSRRLRKILIGWIAILLPLYPTALLIRYLSGDYTAGDGSFVRQASPLLLVNIVAFAVLHGAAITTLVQAMRTSSGVKRNQLKFVTLAFVANFVAIFFYFLSFTKIDLPWVYFPLQMASTSCIAYAIFKYRLFDFGEWARRAVVVVAVYAVLISLPFFAFFPFRRWMGPQTDNLLWTLTLGSIVYGVLFALAPTFIGWTIRRRLEKMSSRAAELLDLDQMKRTFIAHISHEFKSPVAIVENATAVLLEDAQQGGVEKSKLIDYLTMIREGNDRLGQFVGNLLEIAKIDHGNIDLSRRWCNVRDLVSEAGHFFRGLIDKKKLEFRVDGDDIDIFVDREKISHVFGNVISNAVKYTDAGGIVATVSRNGNSVEIKIKDSGRGIPPEYLPRVFEKFFRMPESAGPSPKGTGLGLSIARGWTEAHGGEFRIESEGLGKGAAVIVKLPINFSGPIKNQ